MNKHKFKQPGENSMAKVIYDISMSLDGYITGANPFPEAGWGGLGEGGEKLHAWGFGDNVDPRNQEIMDEWASVGASIFGRTTTYDLSILNWGADGPTGADRVPVVIVSHSVPDDVPGAGAVYHFVDNIEAAFETAKKLAGDKYISITGSDVAKQFLQRGYINELSIHVVPVVFGSGTRLFGDLDSKHIELEPLKVIETDAVTHLRYRVVK
jgi:dihydrofolate reductase